MNDTGLLNYNVFLDLQVWTESLSVAALNFVSGFVCNLSENQCVFQCSSQCQLCAVDHGTEGA